MVLDPGVDPRFIERGQDRKLALVPEIMEPDRTKPVTGTGGTSVNPGTHI